jgi:hypothetical protein
MNEHLSAALDELRGSLDDAEVECDAWFGQRNVRTYVLGGVSKPGTPAPTYPRDRCRMYVSEIRKLRAAIAVIESGERAPAVESAAADLLLALSDRGIHLDEADALARVMEAR